MTEKLLKEIKKHNDHKFIKENPNLELNVLIDEKKEYTPEEITQIEETLKEVKKELKNHLEEEMKETVLKLLKEIKEYNLTNSDNKFKLSTIEDKKILENIKKKSLKKQFGKFTDKELATISSAFINFKKALKEAKKLEEAKALLESEEVELPDSNEEIIIKAKKIKDSPKFPFEIRVYGYNIASKFSLKKGKRYLLDEVKNIVIQEFFELKKATFEYDKERNSVFVVMASSKKG